jgi:excisionase family DNA binding protein
MEKKEFLTVAEAANLMNVGKMAIQSAIVKKRLKAHKASQATTSKWLIDPKDLEEYKNTKYTRDHSCFEGELLYDKRKGEFSVKEAAEVLNIPVHKIYYLLRTEKINSFKKGFHSVIHIDDLKAYQNNREEKENYS